MISKRGTWLLLFILVCVYLVFSSQPGWSRQPLSSKYDEAIQSAVKTYWNDYPDWLYWKAQLYQESRLDPSAKSLVGAEGLAQFMPGTWEQITRQLGWSGISANQAGPAIEAGAFYMAKLRRSWSAKRPLIDRHQLAEASYNAGLGSLLRAQQLCGGKPLYADIIPCLPAVTGKYSTETITYVLRIEQWRTQLGK